jgi:phage terminase large subunit GpA-like protein
MASRTGLKSLTCNAIKFDEVEEIEKMSLIDLAMERLSHIENPVVHRLSVPSLPEYGINGFFLRTDQRFWLLKCRRCNEYTCMEDSFPDCLVEVEGRVIRACIKCGSELDTS